MAINKQITLIAKPDCVSSLRALLQQMVAPSRQETGCLKYDLYQYSDTPAQFLLIESWTSETDLNNHKLSDHFQLFKAQAPELLAEKDSISLLAID
ncbi:MAG: antibiotic biosynthesis monooxygenase [Motiliproteus sp.]|nr:antibiotic biosynthesis monooxygenase [Motiliproteus sp.]MCW9052394.1 antibiotic biosynthesis monooxygenase [Motiliproteus sp.]